MAEDADKTGEGAEAPPKKKLNLLAVALGLQCLGLMAATGLIVKAAFFTHGPALDQKHLAERAIASIQDDIKKVQILDLKEFKVNLPKKHLLKASIQVEISDAATAELVTRKMLAVKARVLDVLAGQSMERTTTFQGKLALKEAIRDAINLELGSDAKNGGAVREVFFVDLVLI